MTLDDLVKIYTDTFWRGPKLDSDTADHAAIRAVILAAADWLEREDNDDNMNEVAARYLREAVLCGKTWHRTEHAVPETASNDERKV